MIDRRQRGTGVQRRTSPGAAVAVLVAACLWGSCVTPASVAPRPVVAEPARAPMPSTFRGRRAPRVPLDVATDALIVAIEAETGVRPPGEDDDEVPAPPVRARRVVRGWGPERSALAHELTRAVDRREAGVRAVRRALAALEWDRMVGGRWPEVDEVLVKQAMARAEEALPHEEPAPPDAIRHTLLAWPVIGSHVTSAFGWREDPLEADTQFHAGVDLSAIEGQLVYASASGKVAFAGRRGGYGLHVELEHEGGLVTRYAHLDELVVAKGQAVKQGDPIAYAGRTGRVTGPHLHFELWRGGRPTNPLDELPDDVPTETGSAGR